MYRKPLNRPSWQTVKIQMKCCIMQHFIRVSTVCSAKIYLQRKKYKIIFKIIYCDPSIYYTLIHPDFIDFIVCSFMENPLVLKGGGQWLSGRVHDSRSRDRGFEPHRRHCVVSLSKNINPSLVLVQPRKTCHFITERLLMGCKESNKHGS